MSIAAVRMFKPKRYSRVRVLFVENFINSRIFCSLCFKHRSMIPIQSDTDADDDGSIDDQFNYRRYFRVKD